MQSAIAMESLAMSLERKELYLQLMQTRHSTFVSRMFLMRVSRVATSCPVHLTESHTTGHEVMSPTRHVELDIDIGADAKDWSAIEAGEKLKPIEVQLRRIEELVEEVVGEMDYLRTREQKLRDTNESTNERVKWFAYGTMGMLVGLGAWQVVYLRAYFR